MQALVHFAIGMAGGLVILLFLDFPPRKEFGLLIASGLWGLAPDYWWAFREFGYEELALMGRGPHQSVVSNIFWFHWLLDQLETGNNKLEAGIALAILAAVAITYYQNNDWEIV